MTTTEAANRLRMTRQQVRSLVKKGVLKGGKKDLAIDVDSDDVFKFAEVMKQVRNIDNAAVVVRYYEIIAENRPEENEEDNPEFYG